MNWLGRDPSLLLSDVADNNIISRQGRLFNKLLSDLIWSCQFVNNIIGGGKRWAVSVQINFVHKKARKRGGGGDWREVWRNREIIIFKSCLACILIFAYSWLSLGLFLLCQRTHWFTHWLFDYGGSLNKSKEVANSNNNCPFGFNEIKVAWLSLRSILMLKALKKLRCSK